MKYLLLFLLFPFFVFSQDFQSKINAYKYIVIEKVEGCHKKEGAKYLTQNFDKAGFKVVNLVSGFIDSHPDDLKKNKNLALYCSMYIAKPWCSDIDIYLKTYDGTPIYTKSVTISYLLLSSCLRNILKDFVNSGYKYDSTQTTQANKNPYNKRKSNEWISNGSGIIISKSGHIITNNHVIDDAEDIEVEFILDGEVQKFNAEIVQVDKTNDLAIIKIVDVNFDGVANLPYNFKTRSSDVGTKVYAYGYPMALSIMGKEIKVTDGIISSKTGFDGNITTYQITAPIQGGSSGGPLFDDKGNLIGINSSGIRKDIADNVGYSIKTNYVLNLIDILPKSIDLPSSNKLSNLPLTEQIKQLTKYVVLVKVK